jgi:hypothetical protein
LQAADVEYVRAARGFRHEKESAAAARCSNAAGEGGAWPVTQKDSRCRARLVGAAECAENDYALRFALLRENAVGEARAVFAEQF